ncbi:hypothetical protein [Bacteroides eggerthii]|uniref:hypothetical protein n=1 Tax=Bacteroides eggerthii TaxID=28111 RepID=UPI001C71266E|nr:hypothetical protein [Bacteroides eggerthii]
MSKGRQADTVKQRAEHMVNDTEPRSARNVAETPVDMLLRSVRGNRKDTLADSKQQVVERERGEAPAQFIGTRRRGIAARKKADQAAIFQITQHPHRNRRGGIRAGMRDTVGNSPEGGDGSLRFVCQHCRLLY